MEHREGHAQLAQILIDREVIFAEDVERIFGKRPWTSRTDEILAANEEAEKKEQENNETTATDHKAENEDIIRKKAIQAILEKEKEKEHEEPNH